MTRPCPVCGAALLPLRRTTDFVREREFALVRCGACTLVTVDPVPSADELAPYYGDSFYTRPSAVSGGAQRLFLALRARQVSRRHRLPCRLLDVGCGDGAFLQRMHALGCDVVGVEPSEAGASRARDRSAMVHRSLDEVVGPFDVVTLWHVLEHVAEPVAYLARLRGLLAPGGVLLIAVPNIASVEAARGADAWFHLDVPRHLQHFNPRSLTTALEAAGLEPGAIETFSLEYGPFGLIQTGLNLLPIERNALYDLVKFGRPFRSFKGKTRLALAGLCAAAPMLGAVALGVTAVQSLTGRGSTLTVAARCRTTAPTS